ncbi:hypothetical protein LXA43DRAFT_1103311 [Ganoderma leucocontextum]|nr:hypothetical protein LXA43DRAFT_1103311 [Ganoderma leucocontextum]
MAIWDDFEATMNAPETPALFTTPAPSRCINKCARTDAELLTDNDDLDGTPPPTTGPNKNLVTLARNIASAQMLPDAQVQEVAEFAADTFHVQNIKLFTALKAIKNKLSKLHTPTGAFKVSEALIENLNSYAHGVFFSSKLKMYKGTVPRDHLLDILKALRFDLPAGIEHDHAKWNIIKRAAGTALTNVHGKVKKALVKSVASKNPREHFDIFTLAIACIVNTSY